jgi:hypothetical protein
MCAVGVALAWAAGVYVHVGDDTEAATSADLPELTEVSSIESDDTGVERAGIEIIIENEVYDPGNTTLAAPEEERTALSTGVSTALAQLREEPLPHEPRAGDFMLR